jgi:hypothetical protein
LAEDCASSPNVSFLGIVERVIIFTGVVLLDNLRSEIVRSASHVLQSCLLRLLAFILINLNNEAKVDEFNLTPCAYIHLVDILWLVEWCFDAWEVKHDVVWFEV